MEAAGIEPACESGASVLAVDGYEKDIKPGAANTLQRSDVGCRSTAPIDAGLHKVIAVWSSLPDNIRQAIVMLTDSQSPSGP
jgi:hypothetical protein